MCGIFGSSAKKGYKVDLEKMRVLGLWNERRGPDSSGYYYAGNIEKGVDSLKLMGDLFIKKPFTHGTLDCEVFMGHTRKSTVGANNEVNAHPHTFENYVQTHNGTIRNIWKLCSKYDVDEKEIFVDSIGLSRIIAQRGYDVLNYYQGYAALTMTYTTEPNVLYLYHGASREEAKDENPREERPMFVLDTPEALYYSSIYGSLLHIANGVGKPEILPHNKVYKIEHGILQKEPIYTVKREDVNVKSANEMNSFFDNYIYDAALNLWTPAPIRALPPPKAAPVVPMSKDILTPSEVTINIAKSILAETHPIERFYKDVYFRFGRFFRGANVLLHGVYDIDRDGDILANNGKVTPNVSSRQSEIYYFIRGVMMRDKQNYEAYLEIYKTADIDKAFAFAVSEYSKYPVVNLVEEGKILSSGYRYYWWYNRKKYDGTLQTKFTKRKYVIKHGFFKFIDSPTETASALHLPDSDFIFSSICDGAGPITNTVAAQPELPLPVQPTAEEITLNNVIDLIYIWCDKVITKEAVQTLPEPFLFFIDYFIQEIYAKECPFDVGEQSLAETERQTTIQLKHLITSGKTLRESVKDSEYEYLVCPLYIRKALEDYHIDDVVQSENRYLFTAFEQFDEDTATSEIGHYADIKNYQESRNTDNDSCDSGVFKQQAIEVDAAEEFKENYGQLVEQMVVLEKIADNLQVLDSSDAAQSTCFSVYIAINVIKQKLKDVTIGKYQPLAKDLEKIKSC